MPFYSSYVQHRRIADEILKSQQAIQKAYTDAANYTAEDSGGSVPRGSRQTTGGGQSYGAGFSENYTAGDEGGGFNTRTGQRDYGPNPGQGRQQMTMDAWNATGGILAPAPNNWLDMADWGESTYQQRSPASTNLGMADTVAGQQIAAANSGARPFNSGPVNNVSGQQLAAANSGARPQGTGPVVDVSGQQLTNQNGGAQAAPPIAQSILMPGVSAAPVQDPYANQVATAVPQPRPEQIQYREPPPVAPANPEDKPLTWAEKIVLGGK